VGSRPRGRGVPGSVSLPSFPHFLAVLGLSPFGSSSRPCLVVGSSGSLFRLPLAGGGHFFPPDVHFSPSLRLPFASRRQKFHFSPLGGLRYSELGVTRPSALLAMWAPRRRGRLRTAATWPPGQHGAGPGLGAPVVVAPQASGAPGRHHAASVVLGN
jgi:hypothetical protein